MFKEAKVSHMRNEIFEQGGTILLPTGVPIDKMSKATMPDPNIVLDSVMSKPIYGTWWRWLFRWPSEHEVTINMRYIPGWPYTVVDFSEIWKTEAGK